MSNSVSKAIVAGLASLSLAASVFALTEPVSAQQWHGGGGGWHGGGTGGWHGASVRGWRSRDGGWHYGGYWHRGYRRGGNWYNGWWNRESVPASCSERLAAYPYYGAPYGYYACWQSRSTYSASGVYLGYQMVNIVPIGPRQIDREGLANARPFFYRGAGLKMPPVTGTGTPVVVGRESGRPRRERRAR